MTQFETTTGQARSHIANYILIIAALLLLFSYPFRDLFWGGLIMHLSGAALIGGLADWYAVTALFRRPLGISFKTALIPSSKERIAETARHMIESEILTVPNMYQVLKHHPVLEAGLSYLHTEKGFQSAERVLGHVLNTFLYTLDMKKIVEAFSDMGADAIEKIRVAPIMGKAFQTGLVGESGNDFLDFLICTLESMTKSETAKRYIADIYRESLRQYEHRNFVYALIVKAALASDMFSPERVAANLQEKFLAVLQEAKKPDSEERKKAMQFIWRQAEQLEVNPAWQERLESYKMRLFHHVVSRPDMKEAWQRYVQDPDRQNRICRTAATYAIERLEGWKSSDLQVEQMNRMVLALAAKELKRLQTWFGATAEKEILAYDAQELADALESRVWYDLQMIRVNGSLVGAVLGACFFLAMYALKGGW